MQAKVNSPHNFFTKLLELLSNISSSPRFSSFQEATMRLDFGASAYVTAAMSYLKECKPIKQLSYVGNDGICVRFFEQEIFF
jgi:hypothetical protein